MEFIDFAKNEMESMVQRLYEIDPFWKRCSPCVLNGKCCKGANPCFSQKELVRVLEKNTLTAYDLRKLKWNLRLGIKCPFHTRDKCIIHENRSLNCMWTPYYVTVDDDDNVHYYKIDDKCRFKKVEVNKKDIEFRIDEGHFVWLPHDKGMRCHIYLNSLNFINRGYIWDIPATEVGKNLLKTNEWRMNMKRLLILFLTLSMMMFAGCASNDVSEVNDENPPTANEINDTDKFFPEDKIFTAQLLYEYMVEFEEYQDENGTQQTYIFDLRSADEYAKGHVYGAVNLSKEECAELFDKLYTDSHVLFIGEGAEELAEKFRVDYNAAYAVQGGYEAIEAIDGMEKYITTKEFEIIDIREVDDEPIESKAYSYVASC